MFSRGKQAKSDRDWVDEASDSIEKVIDGIRDKAVVPLTTAARAVVYGLLAGIIGIAAVVLLAVVFVRLLDVYLDYIPMAPEGVWLAHFVAGAIFVVAGLFIRGQRYPKKADQKS